MFPTIYSYLVVVRLGTRMADFRIPCKSSKFSLCIGSPSHLSRLRRNFVSLVANYKCLFQINAFFFLFYKEVVRKTTPTSGVALLVGHVQSGMCSLLSNVGWSYLITFGMLFLLLFFVCSHLTSLLQVVYNGKKSIMSLLSYTI